MDDTVSNMPREEEKVGGVTHTEVAHSELVRSDGEHYRMTKTTFMAVIAFSWSWACVSCMNTTATTVSHQIASVGGVGDIAWISNASLIVQASLQAVMASNILFLYNAFRFRFHTGTHLEKWANEIIAGIFW